MLFGPDPLAVLPPIISLLPSLWLINASVTVVQQQLGSVLTEWMAGAG